jgi:DNA-binding NarL/FixJ family response regulator
LILMDMQMPKMDGIEACIEINKCTGGHPRANIVFVTAHVSDSFRQTCLENGAFGYLPKPCTLEGVSEVLRHAMGQGSLFSPVYTASWNQNTSPTSKRMEPRCFTRKHRAQWIRTIDLSAT